MEMDRQGAMEIFVRVIEAGSFSGAAKQLHVGQPAVSKTIAQLEDRLGVRLLLRSTHGLSPTEAGRSFYDHAKRSIEEADEAELAARGAAATLTGRLRIWAAVSFGRLHVIPRLSAFLAEHPSLDVDVVLDDRDVDLIEARIDVALRIGELGDSALATRKIGQCRRRVIATPAFFEASGVPQAQPTSVRIRPSSTSNAQAARPGSSGREPQQLPSPWKGASASALPRESARGCWPASALPSRLSGFSHPN
jgi:DNA-binding transcriptional LysR family regulator